MGKNRLAGKKITDVNKMLNPKKSLRKRISNTLKKAKFALQDKFKGMNPFRRIGMKKRLEKINSMKSTPNPAGIQARAVDNLQMLKTKQAMYKMKSVVPKSKPAITSPSPASVAYNKQKLMKAVSQPQMKGPSRPPPPPPSNVPARPAGAVPKVAPRVPPKPKALAGRKLR